MQEFVQLKEFFHFAFDQAGNGNAGPPTDDGGNILLIHFLFEQAAFILFLAEVLLFQFKLSFEPWQLAVAQLSDLIQVVRSFELLDFLFHFFDLLTDFSELTDRVFLGLPARLERLEIAVFLGQFFFDPVRVPDLLFLRQVVY